MGTFIIFTEMNKYSGILSFAHLQLILSLSLLLSIITECHRSDLRRLSWCRNSWNLCLVSNPQSYEYEMSLGLDSAPVPLLDDVDRGRKRNRCVELIMWRSGKYRVSPSSWLCRMRIENDRHYDRRPDVGDDKIRQFLLIWHSAFGFQFRSRLWFYQVKWNKCQGLLCRRGRVSQSLHSVCFSGIGSFHFPCRKKKKERDKSSIETR
jgi:hypothetical protein